MKKTILKLTSLSFLILLSACQQQTSNHDYNISAKSTLKSPPSGLIMRGKTKGNFCDLARGNVDGGYCQIFWKDLEPNEGEFNFDLIDQAVNHANEYNQKKNLTGDDRFKVLIRIRAGVSSPDWVKESTGNLTWYFKDLTRKHHHKLPIFWQTSYQEYYKNMMIALAKRYDNNELVGGVAASMCMTVHSEIMWNRTGRGKIKNAEKKTLRALNMQAMRTVKDKDNNLAPYNNEKDYNCLLNQITIHKDTWTRTSTLFGSHLYQVFDLETGEKHSDYAKTIELFKTCRDELGSRCILGNNSLMHNENITSNNVNKAVHDMSSPIYFQTHVFKGVGRKHFNFENLKVALTKAAAWGAFLVEMPMGWDCEDIHSKNNTQCKLSEKRSKELALYRKALKNNPHK